MPRMGKHSPAEAANKRARVSAWLVFISMAGTTMSFQVYHSIQHGHMPPPLAVLYGVVPLFISMLVIEVVSGWENAPEWARWAAYVIIGGAMYLSAAATGAVVVRAAPPHSSLLFGLLLDGAAILAARFLMTAVKRTAGAELAAARLALAAEREATETVAAELAAAGEGRERAEAELAAARREAETLRRELAEARKRKDREPSGNGGGSGSRKRQPVPRPEEADDEAPSDLDSEARVLWYLDKGYSASKAGVMAGLTDSRGRQIKRERDKLSRPAPRGIDEGGPS